MSWIAVIVAGLLYFVFGGLWFSKFAFGKKWDEALGFDRPEGWKETTIYFVGPAVGSLVASVAMALLGHGVGVASFGDAVSLGLVTGIGFAATVSVTNAINPKIPKPLLYGAVTGSYHVLGAVLLAVIQYAIAG